MDYELERLSDSAFDQMVRALAQMESPLPLAEVRIARVAGKTAAEIEEVLASIAASAGKSNSPANPVLVAIDAYMSPAQTDRIVAGWLHGELPAIWTRVDIESRLDSHPTIRRVIDPQAERTRAHWPATIRLTNTREFGFAEEAGRGGTAIVARYTSSAGDVAVKALSNHRFPTEALELRFLREGEILRSISHPNIVEVIEVIDVIEVSSRVLLVMEMLHGGSLAERVKSGAANSAQEAVSWITQLLTAVAALEQHGVVHRDISPKNLMFRETGELVLTDFGTSRHLDDATMTLEKDPIGSLIYISPEQFQEAHAVDSGADLYATGQVAFYLLTGIAPQGNVGELAQYRGHDLPMTAAVVDRLRRYRRSDRFGSAEEALTALTEAFDADCERGAPLREVIRQIEKLDTTLEHWARDERWAFSGTSVAIPFAVLDALEAMVKLAVPSDASAIFRSAPMLIELQTSDDGWIEGTFSEGASSFFELLATHREEIWSGDLLLIPRRMEFRSSGPDGAATNLLITDDPNEKVGRVEY